MDDIDDKSIDMILCDLPYGTTACKWDTVIPFEPLWNHYKRIIKDNGAIVLTANQPFTTSLINSNNKYFRYTLVWNKKFAGNFANANRQFMKTHEDIIIFYRKQPTYNPQKIKRETPIKTGKIVNPEFMVDKNFHQTIKTYDYKFPVSILDFPREIGRTIHPTQKPVALFEYLIKTYTNEGDLVLDNCAGSGTTGIACINTNRDYILIEKEQKYYDMINERINKVKGE
jgi:site-specific DNA-methyltransferase (adenine-specific)